MALKWVSRGEQSFFDFHQFWTVHSIIQSTVYTDAEVMLMQNL